MAAARRRLPAAPVAIAVAPAVLLPGWGAAQTAADAQAPSAPAPPELLWEIRKSEPSPEPTPARPDAGEHSAQAETPHQWRPRNSGVHRLPPPDDLGATAQVPGPTAPAAETPAPGHTELPADDAEEPPAQSPAAGLGPAAWKLPQPCLLQRWGAELGGWVQQGITFNADRPADRFNGTVTTNDRDSEYQLNQAWLYLVRPTHTGGYGWDLGGRIDVIYGTDWRYGQSAGLEDRINSANRFYGLVLPQFYAEVAWNDLAVKLGHFATMTSYEVVPSPMNFFYSHSYLMAGYFDPLLVTGFQAEYKWNEEWTLSAGMNNGWLTFEDPGHTYNFLGGAKWSSGDGRTRLSVMVDTGTQLGFTGPHVRTSVYTVLVHQLNEKLTYAGQVTAGRESEGSFIRPGEDAQWYGMEHVLIRTFHPKWSAGVRYEWVRDEDGARIAGIGGLLGTDRGWRGLPGFSGSFHEFSLGLNWRPHPNAVLRPEIRWDWYDGPANPFGQLPFDDKRDASQFTAAVDLLVTF